MGYVITASPEKVIEVKRPYRLTFERRGRRVIRRFKTFEQAWKMRQRLPFGSKSTISSIARAQQAGL